MNAPESSEVSDSLMDQTPDFSLQIAALRLAGADQFDRVQFHYLEVLVHRLGAQRASVKRILADKLVAALASFKERFEQAQRKAGAFTGVMPGVALSESNDRRESLGDLARSIAQHSPEYVDADLDDSVERNVALRPELKTLRHFRNTWSKLSVDKQLTQALDQAPRNAGPVNSHMLVLRSLALMRDISPDYLNRFMSYADTLLCLDQNTKGKSTPAKKSLARKTPLS
jgi:hypothetical protein